MLNKISSGLATAQTLAAVLNSRVIEDAGDDYLRESIKEQVLQTVKYLTRDELNALLEDFQKILISIGALPASKQISISLLISKSEVLALVGIIYDKLQRYDLALENFAEARAIEKIANAFISAKTDWCFLNAQLDSAKTPSKEIIESLEKNLPVLIEHYRETGNEEAMAAARKQLMKVKSLVCL